MKVVFFLLVGLILASAVVGSPLFGSRPTVDEVEECSDLTRFKEGYVYDFTYEAVTETGIRGAGPGSTMTMTCDVRIEAPERCRNVLKTTSCRLDESPEFAREMSDYDLTFRTDNGRIVEVLAHPDEPMHILNAKRGILSMIQLDMEADDVDQVTINEVSVHGNCSSDMTVTRRDDNNRPRKVQVETDLNSCLLRRTPENMTRWQSFLDVVTNTTIVDKFINSSKTCNYDVKGTSGEFKGIECSEVHSFWPMNFNSESGVRTSIQQSLISTDILRLNSFKVDSTNTRSTSLRYEYDPKEIGRKPDDVTADQAMDILKQLVKGSREEVRMDSPRLFSRWRAALEGMNNATIHEVFDRAYDCGVYSESCRNNPDKVKLAREYLLDGLLPCTTMACFSVKNYAIAKGIVPKPLANAWMVTMALRDYPTLDVMSEMLRMAQASPSQITIFPLSIMVHNYWVNNEELRTSVQLPEQMVNTIRWLKSLIGTDCTITPENERLALIALKAIGNIGEPVERHDQLTFIDSDKVTPSLVNCARNKDIARDIAKAAVQSMRRFALDDQLRRQIIEKLFKDTTLDVPRRIFAYLIAMKANPAVSELTSIWEFLKTEPVNQMKAFCYSHIANVLESSEPTLQQLKKDLRKAMVDDVLPEYPKNIRKYSRYLELSKNLTEPWRNNTLAAQFEGDIIFTPESYLPQEVMIHYVLNALGKSWDIFETGIEMKGFEPIMESIFGPEGFFPEITLQNLFENLDENILSRVREFAEAQLEKWVSPEAEPQTNSPIFKKKFNKKVKRQLTGNEPSTIDLIHETTMNKLNRLHELVGMETAATDATVFLRLFGNEFGFVSASDILSLIPYTMGVVEEFMNKTKQIPELLAEGLDFNTTRSVVFMDKSFILPTGLGMPLNCSVNGTAVLSLRVRSQFSIQLPRIVASGHIAPSAAVEVLASMGIGMPTKVFTGVMGNATAYHSSKMAGNITIDGTRLKINLNNTDRPMNLFNYSTTYNLLKANGNVEFIPGVLQDAVKSQRCTNVSRVLGVDLCVSWAYPNASYVENAPRFPFAGPNSFNVTLVNTDKALKAYTVDVQYKQIKEGGASKPVAFASIGKKNKETTQPITKLTDTFRVSFYAPGEELTRNVTSFLSIDRLRKTAKWTVTVPEVKNFIMFAGIVNETTESSSAYRAVFNVSAAENAASVDFLLKNDSTLAQKNLTAVFNASINSLYWAVVGQFLRQSSSGDWNAHATETYYWDNETPLYKQILFPWTGYSINHEKYRTTSLSAERRTAGQTVHRDFNMATLGWSFDVNTRQTITDDLKELTLSTRISNATWEFPLFDASLRNETTEFGYRNEATLSRKTHHAFMSYVVTKEPRETNHIFRTGVRTDVFVSNPDVALFMNSPMLLKLFGETALIDEPIVIDGGINFRILDQSDRTTEHLIQTSILVPNPRNPTTHLTYDFDLRLENATVLHQKDYSLELSLPIPLLKLTNINLVHLMIDTEVGTATGEHFLTMYDNRYNKGLATMSNSVTAGWKKPAANWVMNVETPSLTYFQNYTGLYTCENGLQYFFEYSQDSSVSDLLDFTEINKISLRPTALSMYWSYIHKLMSYNASSDLRLDGPITEMRPVFVPMIVRSIWNKTISKDFEGVKDIILNKLIFNITSSSLTLTQSANLTSHIIGNVTASHDLFVSLALLNHKISFNADHKLLNVSSGFNHSLVIQNHEITLKTEGRLRLSKVLKMSTITSLNSTLATNMAFLHDSRVNSQFITFSTLSSANGNVGENKMLNLVANHNTSLSSYLGLVEAIGNYNIEDMSSLFNFNEMTGVITYKMASRFVKSSFNSSVSLNTFRKLFKFQKVQTKFSHDIKSSLVNWDAHGQSLLQHFSSITEFGEVSNHLEANIRSKIATASHSSAVALRNMNGFVQFDELIGYVRNNVTSKLVNSSYETEIDVNNVDSVVSFRRLGGTSNYVLSSRLMNVTANNTVDLAGFRSMFNFDSISGNQIWFVKTRLLNATMDNAVALHGFKKPFNFTEVSGRVLAKITSLLASGQTETTLLIQNVESITSVANVAFQSNTNFTSHPVNTSVSSEFTVTNHRSLLNFDRISSMMTFTSKIFNVSSTVMNDMSLNGVRSFANFDSINHLFSANGNSYYLNTSLSESVTLRNFRNINMFDLSSVEILSSFVTPLLTASYQQEHKIENMNGWFNYPLAESIIRGNMTTRWLNVSSSYVGRIVNMGAQFEYESGLAKVEYNVRNRIVNVTGFHGVQIRNMRGMFNFDRINGTISHKVDTPISRMNVGGILEMNGFQSLFNFNLVDISTSNIFSISPLSNTYATYNAGLALRGFEKFNKFNAIEGFSRTSVLTKWTNWTANVESEFSNFRTFLDYDHIVIAGQNEFYSPIVVLVSNTTNNIIGSTGFLKASSAQSRNMFSIISRIGKVESGAWWYVTDLTGPTRFSANNLNANLNVSTPLFKTGSAFVVEMNEWENITHFGKYEMYAANDITTRVASWNLKSGFRLDNMAGVLTYSHAEGSATSKFTSIITSFNTSINAHINGQSGLLTYDEMVISTEAMFSSWPLKWQGATGFNVANMNGFMTYDSIYGSASSNMRSSFINTTATTSLRANAGTGLFKVQLANVSGSMEISTPLTKSVKASTSAQIKNSRKLFNFDEAALKTDVSFLTARINITGNTRSRFVTFANITHFESVESSADMAFDSSFFNSTTHGIVEMRGFERLFRFEKVKFGGYSVMESILANMTAEGGADFTNFRQLFTFERINGSAIATLKSKYAIVDIKSGIELNNFAGPTTFDRFNASIVSNFNSTIINTTAGAGYTLQGFRSLFNFDTVQASAQAVLTNRFVNGTAMADYALTDSACFCRFGRLTARSGGSFNTKVVTGNTLATLEINNVRNLTSFDEFNTTAASRLVSKPVTVVGEALYTIKNQQQLFKFESATGRAYGYIRSKIFNTTTLLESQMNNSRSLFGFDGAVGQASMIVRTPIHDAHFHGHLNLMEFTNITHYTEMSGMVAGNLSSAIIRASAFSNFNMTRMAGVMTFDKFTTESFGTLETQLVNTSLQNSITLRGFQLLDYSSIAHRFNFIWVDPVSELVVKNGLDMKSIKDMSQLFNITWVNPKGTVVFTQRLNYENLLASIKVPSIGRLTAGANLNSFGDVLTFYIEHELVRDNFKRVKDITWLLRLNESNVIYSNFSWNPETVAEIVDVTVGAINSTFNRTITIANSTITKIMEIANKTLTHTRRLTNCTKCFMRYTVTLANDTLRTTLKEFNQTLYAQAVRLNETLYAKAVELNQTFYVQLKKLNTTFYEQLERLNKTIVYARTHPREFIRQYVNLTRLNETIRMINATVRELYIKIKYNITHPKETLENIKTLVKFEERLEKITWLIENRDVVKTKVIEYLKELKTNLTEKVKDAITDFREYTQLDAAFERVNNYVETRFNVPKILEKIAELRVWINDIKQKMNDLKVKAGEKVNELKMKIKALNKATIKAEIQARIELMKEFILHYLNSTTLDAIERSIFIDYNDDAQVQELMRKVIRIRPRNLIDIIDKDSVLEVKDNLSEAKTNVVNGLRLLNETTFRYVNKTFLNETVKQAIQTFKEWNVTLHEYVYVDVIKGDVRYVLNLSKEKIQAIVNTVVKYINSNAQKIKAELKKIWDARPKSLQEVMERLAEMRAIIREEILVRYNVDIDEVTERVIAEVMQRREQIETLIGEVIALSKNETHPINMLPLCYFNRTIYQIAQPPINMTTNLTVYYSKMAVDLSKVYGKQAVNLTRVYSRLAMEKSVALTKKYIPIVKEMVKQYKQLAIEKSQEAREVATVYFNMAKGNATLYYQKYAPIVNETIRTYTSLARQVAFNYTIRVREVTSEIINMTIQYLEPHVAPYRLIMMEKVEMLKVTAANLKERAQNLPAQTEQYLMDFAEYHIDRYPEYKQKTIEKIEELKLKLEELKVNVTNLYGELKVNLTRLAKELKQNATEAYNRFSEKALEMYSIGRGKFNNYSMQAKMQWKKMKPIIITKSGEFFNASLKFFDATKLRVNTTVKSIISTTKDEFSLVNELPMRILDKTIYQLTVELKQYIHQLILDAKTNINTCIRSRECLLNKYPMMYLNMTVFEAGNFSYEKVLAATNLTRFYANKTIHWANSSLVATNATFYDILIVSNQTMREIIIPFVNQTTRDVIAFLNRTRTQSWNATLNETIAFINRTSVILRNKANETFIVVRAKAIEAWKNLTSEESIARMKAYLNNTRDMVLTSIRIANETIYMLRNKSIEIIIYIRDETPLINMSRQYAIFAKNLTQDSIIRARNITRNTMFLARNMTEGIVTYIRGPVKDYTMEYVTYINDTVAGWAFRYYEVEQIPCRLRMRLAMIKPAEIAGNLTVYAINRTRLITEIALNRTRAITYIALNRTEVFTRFAMNQTRVMTQLALNKTRILTKQAINRTRNLIRDTLNTIGRLDDNSFAVNISHPFNWTSFRTLPRLSNNQIKFIKDKVTQFNSTVFIPALEKLLELRVNLTEKYNDLSRKARELYEQKRPIVEAKIEEYRVKIQERIADFKTRLNEYKDAAEEKWESELKPALQEMKEDLIEMWEEEIKPEIEEVVSDLKEFLQDPERLSRLMNNARYFKNEYLPWLKHEIFEEKYPELRTYIMEEKYPEIREYILAKYEVGKELFEEFKANLTDFRQKMEVKIQKLNVQARELWTDLKEQMVDFRENWPETYEKIKADLEDVKIQLKAKISAWINKMLSILRELRIPVEILPLEHITLYNPWKYTAMIFGENHVMTFDGKVFSVPPYSNEHRTYVLAHDFVDRNFTLLAQQNRITLLVRNISVSIDDQNVVRINGEPSVQELPYQTPFSKEMTVMRRGPWVNVTTTKGIALLCHSDHFMCIFHLSGWYHGKSRGLLGNLDTEHHNEFLLPEGDVTTDLDEFISAYDVSPLDLPRNVVPSRLGSCFAAHEKCSALFKEENSIVRETFDLINKTEFYNFCIKQTGMCRSSCEASNPTVTLGKELNANVSYDPECLDCVPNEISEEMGRATSTADIIFVVSETTAMAEGNIIIASLKTIANRIKTKLNSYNLANVRFGIVAYGGANIRGKHHTQTLCGQLMDDNIDCVDSGIDSLVFEGERPIDAMHAIQLAATYPFRKDAAKIINLFADEDLMEESGKPWDYIFNINTSESVMKNTTLRQGINFNVFSNYPTLNKQTSDSPILGVNYLGKQIINKKNSGEVGVDRLAIPKGQYAKLAKATRGSIMGLSWVQNGHRDMNFMLPKVIWKQIQPQTSGGVDFTCRCVIGVYGESRNECQW